MYLYNIADLEPPPPPCVFVDHIEQSEDMPRRVSDS